MRGLICVLLLLIPATCFATAPPRVECKNGKCYPARVAKPEQAWPARGPFRWTGATGRWVLGFPARTPTGR